MTARSVLTAYQLSPKVQWWDGAGVELDKDGDRVEGCNWDMVGERRGWCQKEMGYEVGDGQGNVVGA